MRASLIVMSAFVAAACGRSGFTLDASDASRDATPSDARASDAFPADWWDTSFAHRNKITIHGSMLDEGVDSFPLYIDLGASNVILDAIQAAGNDLRFIADDGVTQLPYEIEAVTATDFAVWVNIPHIQGRNADDSLWVYYGNPSAPAGAQPDLVWPDPFVAVWHLTDDRDSTQYRNDGVFIETSSTTGLAGGARDFNTGSAANAYVRANDSTTFESLGNAELTTWSGWVSPVTGAAGSATLVTREQGGGNGDDFWLGLDLNNSPTIDMNTSQSEYATTGQPLPYGSWSLVAMTYRATTVEISVNGVEVATTFASGNLDASTNPVFLGARCGMCDFVDANDSPFNGALDEVRIENVARPDSWLVAEYANLAGSTPLVTFDATEP